MRVAIAYKIVKLPDRGSGVAIISLHKFVDEFVVTLIDIPHELRLDEHAHFLKTRNAGVDRALRIHIVNAVAKIIAIHAFHRAEVVEVDKVVTEIDIVNIHHYPAAGKGVPTV